MKVIDPHLTTLCGIKNMIVMFVQAMCNAFHIHRDTNNKAPEEHYLQAEKTSSKDGKGGCHNTSSAGGKDCSIFAAPVG